MSKPEIRQAVLAELERAEGQRLWASELVNRLRDREIDGEHAGDPVKAAIWDLVESREVQWDRDGRIALTRVPA